MSIEILDDIKSDQISGTEYVVLSSELQNGLCTYELANTPASLDVKNQENHNSTDLECWFSNKFVQPVLNHGF